jgi:hypothetical protein
MEFVASHAIIGVRDRNSRITGSSRRANSQEVIDFLLFAVFYFFLRGNSSMRND